MATITELHGTRIRWAVARQDWVATGLTAALILALAIVVGTPAIGVTIASLFVAGMGIAAIAQRVLLPSEFAFVGTLHAAAVVLLAL